MSRDYKVYLEDILDAIHKIRVYTGDISFSTFTADSKTFDAVVRNLEIIGEAARGVPELIRSKHPEVDWKRITGLRNILIHEYFGVDAEIIWDIAQSKLDILESATREMLRE
jgi:uncharacterized protein with HEPN domain